MENLIENYINGNLKDAKRLAKRKSEMAIFNYLRDEHGRTEAESRAIAAFLKGRATFNAACEAEAVAKGLRR